jgi:hypothetical protein
LLHFITCFHNPIKSFLNPDIDCEHVLKPRDARGLDRGRQLSGQSGEERTRTRSSNRKRLYFENFILNANTLHFLNSNTRLNSETCNLFQLTNHQNQSGKKWTRAQIVRHLTLKT